MAKFKVLNLALILFSAISFLGYGSACFWSPNLRREFVRYRAEALRPLVGGLQLLAAAGLILGMSEPKIGQAASGGLALMMLCAVGVRIRIKDRLLQTMPALFYLLLNAYLCWQAYRAPG